MIVHRHYLKTAVQIDETQLGIPQKYKQECIEEIYRLGDSLGKKSNVKALMTDWCIWKQSRVFNPLLKKILETYKKLGYNDSDSGFELIINCAWGAVYKKNDYTKPHDHHPSYSSFVYYLKSNGKTPLIFKKSNFSVSPIDDTLIIFPSYLYHHVPVHEEDEDRVCIAGNIDAVQISDYKDQNKKQT